MARCYKDCKYNNFGYCLKYDDKIIKSENIHHPGLLIHPLDYLSLYYNEDKQDVDVLIAVADKYLNGDDVADSICNYHAVHGYISFKQRKLLLYKIFNCFEVAKPLLGIAFCQVE